MASVRPIRTRQRIGNSGSVSARYSLITEEIGTMRRQLASFFALTFLAAVFALSGCKPDYPNCENDEHCAEKGEVCVNQQCQECRDDTQCQAKYTEEERECIMGRCEVKPECRSDDDCADQGLVCRGEKCVPECTADEDCPEGHSCADQKCVGECEVDVDCGPGRTCVAGACQDDPGAATNISAACQPTTAASGDVVALQIVNFDFDRYDLTINARSNLDHNAECLQQAPSIRIVMEGHCDERGTQEYNLALGEKRAATVRSYLRNLGVDVSRMETVSKGENEPVCRQGTEACWARNRRVQFIQQIGTY
jgi:peptidoglycan-associated lipoprotein